jgi:hypothetical protein
MMQIGLSHSVKKLLTGSARLAALALVPLSLIAQPQKADALLSFYIFEQGATTKIKTIGSLNLPATPFDSDSEGSCRTAGISLDGGVAPEVILSTGTGAICAVSLYQIADFDATPPFAGAVFTGGYGGNDSRYVSILSDSIELPFAYESGDQLDNEVTFNNPISTPLSGSGLIAEWKIMDGTSELDRIKVYLSAPPSAASAPTPLPLAGGALAFGWSRRLRRRAGKAAFSLRA